MLDLSNIKFGRMIVHQVSKRGSSSEATCTLSASCCNMEDSFERPLRFRIINSFGRGSKSIQLIIKSANQGQTPEYCRQILANFDDENIFIQGSKSIANRLASSHTSSNIPEGLLVILSASDDASNKKFLILIKAEKTDGFSSSHTNGNLQLEYLTNLVLSKNSKLFKIGLFVLERDVPETKDAYNDYMSAYVFDYLINPQSGNDAAIYFYSTFMNCSVREEDKNLTKSFFRATKSVIDKIDDEEIRMETHLRLKLYLKNKTNNIIDTVDFRDSNIPEELHEKYDTEMKKLNLSERSFTKNIELIIDKLRIRRIKFDNGVVITSPHNTQVDNEPFRILDRQSNYTDIRVNSVFQGDIN